MPSDLLKRVIEQQRQWAIAQGRQLFYKGEHLASVEDNLFRKLDAEVSLAFGGAAGSELANRGDQPAKMRSIRSSSALAVNFFDAWRVGDPTALAPALGVAPAESFDIRFEKRYPTGLGGTSPHLDVVLEPSTGPTTAIESKFTEWMDLGKKIFAGSYFENERLLWTEVGLSNCQATAKALQAGDLNFRFLDAVQLLKHSLGLATQLGPTCRLLYLYYDAPGPESDEHRREIDTFKSHVGGELDFAAITYQQVFAQTNDAASPDHATYLADRYFPDATD